MDKTYNHKLYEEKIYKEWEDSGAFTPEIAKNKKPFTIIMPPPNASDPLHIGHAREVSTQDILTRFHRMKGDPLPGLPELKLSTILPTSQIMFSSGIYRLTIPIRIR